MTKARKLLIAIVVLIIAFAAVGLYSCWPSSELRLDALAAGTRQAVLDVDHEYATARNFKPAYHGYAIRGDFAFEEVQSRIGDVGVSVLNMDQVRAVDWWTEQGNMAG